MITSKQGLDLIKYNEGIEYKAYQDIVGVWTIGYGHTKGVKEGQMVNEATATELLKVDVRFCENAINAQNVKLNQNQFDALVSFLYNLGTGVLSKFLPDLRKDPNSSKITDRMMLYVYAGNVKRDGLVKRREREVALYKKKVQTV